MYTTAFVCAIGGGAFLLASLFVRRDRQRVERAKVPQTTSIQQGDHDDKRMNSEHESMQDPSHDVQGDIATKGLLDGGDSDSEDA